jgi:hypothetical protein
MKGPLKGGLKVSWVDWVRSHEHFRASLFDDAHLAVLWGRYFTDPPHSPRSAGQLRFLPLRFAPQRGLCRLGRDPRDDPQCGGTVQRYWDAQHRRPSTDDLGNGGLDPFGFSLSVAVRDAAGTPLAADGTFKIPGLRNVELTAPYFHNGGERMLLDVINFYARGGNLGGETNPIQRGDGTVIGALSVLNFNNTTPEAEA